MKFWQHCMAGTVKRKSRKSSSTSSTDDIVFLQMAKNCKDTTLRSQILNCVNQTRVNYTEYGGRGYPETRTSVGKT